MLKQHDDKLVKQKLGIKDKAYKQRILGNLEQYGSLDNAPGQGRPSKYTDLHFQAARDALVGDDTYYFSGEELVSSLVERGELPAGTPARGFMEALHDWLRGHGERLSFGQLRLAFAMTEAHRHGRLEWCEQHQGVLTKASVEEFWFEDEITITYGGHPKGKCSRAGRNRAVPATGRVPDHVTSG